jgi:hypothetical protein
MWKGIVSVEPIKGEQNRYTLSVKIARPNSAKALAGQKSM